MAAPRRDGVDVARILALVLVVAGHLTLALIDRPHGELRGANLLALHPGWAILLAAAPMPVFFAAGGYANATASLDASAGRLRVLAGLGATVVGAWSLAVAVTVLATGEAGIIGDGARLATQPLWFVAAYAPLAAAGRPLADLAARHPAGAIGACLIGLLALDLGRFAFDAPQWIGWPGFLLAWGVPWLAGGWWRDRSSPGAWPERRVGALLAAGAAATAVALVHGFGYAPALIDAVPGARSNTTPPTLYTAVVGLAQVGVVLMVARGLDRLGRRWRRFWDRAGEAAVGIYAWHLTALALCAAAIAAGLPTPDRLTAVWWLTRPLWWAAVVAVTLGFVLATASVRGRAGRRRDRDEPARADNERTGVAGAAERRQVAGVLLLAAGGAAVGLRGPTSLPLAAGSTALFLAASWLLRPATTPRAATPSAAARPRPGS